LGIVVRIFLPRTTRRSPLRHQPPHSATGHLEAFTPKLSPDLAHVVDLQVLLQTRTTSPTRTSSRSARSGQKVPADISLHVQPVCRRGLAQDLVGLAQFADLAFKFLDPLLLLRAQARALPRIGLVPAYPAPQRLRGAADLAAMDTMAAHCDSCCG
jgi:hypothetical protein